MDVSPGEKSPQDPLHRDLLSYSCDLSVNSGLLEALLGSSPEQKNKRTMHNVIFMPLELKSLFFFLQLITASLSWAFQQQGDPPKYQYLDPVTSDLLMCDQCPPGTAVKTHCTADAPTECQACPEKHFAENWHWGDTCQFCTSVCMNPNV